MLIFKKIVLYLLVILSITSGLAKILLMPQETEFFSQLGFSHALLVIYGVAQLAGGILLIMPKFRKLGAIAMIILFAISTVGIFLSGKVGFGIVSILPIMMAVFIFFIRSVNASDHF